jgi:uncharacterized membrane protein
MEIILAQIPVETETLTQVISGDIGRIAWNTFLALVPLTLSFWLFTKPRSRLFCWITYILLGVSFIVGIKKYNNGNFLEALKAIVISLWGVRLIFIAISIGLIIILMRIDFQSRVSLTARYQTSDAGKKRGNRSIFWWVGLLIFIGILPNAPYILTDIIHFYDAVRAISSVWEITFVVVPTYILFIGIGWFSYVFSLVSIRQYLAKYRLDRYTQGIELTLHLLCSIGIYIGRFIRFNTWSLVTEPKQFLQVLPGELIGKFPLVVILLTFLIITVFYAISKPLVQGSAMYVE